MSLMKAMMLKRSVGSVAVRCAATSTAAVDPIQKLFLDKVGEYATKSKASGGHLVDSTPQLEKSIDDDFLKLQRQFNAGGQDMSKFPTFTFTDPILEAVGVEVEIKTDSAETKKSSDSYTSERLYYEI